MQRKLLFFIILFLGLSYWFFLVFQTESGFSKEYPAPDFSIQYKNKTVFELKQTKGKVVLLHFWASWCPPCVDEIPSLNKLYDSFNKDQFEIIGISFDNDKESMESFAKRMKISFPTYWDKDQDTGNLYGTFRLPETYLINQQGMIVHKAAGPQNWESPIWKTKIFELIKTN